MTPPAPAARTAPPVSVGKYRIDALVGEGAMGNVYRAHDPVLNRSVAVKVMNDGIARDASLRDRFMREAQAAGSLQHPNVVTVFDFGEVDGHLFIAMEYVDGVDLERVIEDHVPLTLDQRLGIVIDVLVGLAFAHKRGIVHRDIKPANIRITEDGRTKIMDFGIAHLESSKMTATGVLLGTPNYMAPELVTGQPVSPATDVFSVGAVLYELLSGQRAFSADSLHAVLFKVVSTDPPALEDVVPSLPSGIVPIVRRALAKDPEGRYASAVEMADDLAHERAHLSAAHRSGSLSLAATIARAARPVLALPPRGATAKPQDTPAAGARSRLTIPLLAAAAVSLIAVTALTTVLASRSDSTATTDSLAATSLPALGGTASPSVDSAAARADSSLRAALNREQEIVTLVKTSALAARQRAREGGASAQQLAEGDLHLATADRLAEARRYPNAVAALNAATRAWSAATATSTPAPSRTNAPVAAVDITPETAATKAAVADTQLSSPPPIPVVTESRAPVVAPKTEIVLPPRDVAADIRAAIASYGRAIESRDVANIRGVFPGLPTAQAQGFEQFFRAIRSLRVSLNAGAPEVSESTATTRVSGSYDFVDQAGKQQRQPVTFVASLRHDATGWHIVGVR